MTARPSAVRLRAYRVGYGDCLLLTVTYGSALPDRRRARHLLVDCGTAAPAAAGPSLAQVAAQVAEHCEGRLDVVVATHGYRDHVSAFGDPESGAVLRPLAPRVVIRPWPDMPRRDGLDARAQEFASLVDGVSTLAGRLPRLAFDSDREARLAGRLATLAQAEPEAARLLDEWGRTGRTEYVAAGDTVDVSRELPGVDIQVLGPPRGEGVSALLGAGRGSVEPWLRLAASDELPPLLEQPPAGAWTDAARVLAAPAGVGAASWLLRTLSSRRLTQGLEVVSAFGDFVHDLSAALLITVGNRTLLLPGDARAVGLERRLAGVDVLKVSRHGDRAGTSRRLLDRWRHRSASAHPLVSLVPTEPGVVPAVPDDELLAELAALGPVHRTDQLPDGVWWLDLAAPARGRAPFACAAGPVMS